MTDEQAAPGASVDRSEQLVSACGDLHGTFAAGGAVVKQIPPGYSGARLSVSDPLQVAVVPFDQ